MSESLQIAILFFVIVVLCFFGGWYGSRRVIGGLATAAIGPVVLGIAWLILWCVFSYTLLIFAQFFPGLGERIFRWLDTFPDVVLFALNPATICSAAGLILYFRYERMHSAPPPAGFTDPAGRGYDGQPAPPEDPKILPTIRRFRY